MRVITQRALLAVLLILSMAAPAGAQGIDVNQPPAPEGVRPQLWAPEQPVDILVYNPYRLPLDLPQPYTPPSIAEVYGPGVTEEDLLQLDGTGAGTGPLVVTVGANITFAITYGDGANEGFNDPTLGNARRTAFQHGVAQWASRLQGPASISVNATMTPRGGSATSAVLASGGPGQFHENFTNAPVANTYYAEGLVEIITGSDPDNSTFDINVDFNSDVDNGTVLGPINWYYGTDANPGIHVDFATITIHELCHGLGFIASFQSSGAHGLGPSSHPVIYDRYLVNGAGQALISLPVSSANVTGNNVFWNGLLAKFVYVREFSGVPGAPNRLPIFAPTTWDAGSSIHHIDETLFTGAWELQTPYNDGPVHVPDEIVLGILQDTGHSLAQSRYVDDGASGFEDGSKPHPYNTVVEGVNAVPTSGFVRILPGAYAETMTINRAMELHSAGGTATIGSSGARAAGQRGGDEP